MTTSELKSLLHETIEKINDDEVLMLLKEIAEEEIPYAAPTANQLHRIKEAEKQISEGKYLTNEEADRLVEKWLSE